MPHTLRTICSLLLSLALVVMPLQSFAMMPGMDDSMDEQVSAQHDADSGCPHGDSTVVDNSNCCLDQCQQDCDHGCSTHISAATLPVANLAQAGDTRETFANPLDGHHSRAPAPPLPPPLI